MTLETVIEKIDQLLNDTVVPRNVKRVAEHAKNVLLNPSEEDINIKKNEAFSLLEDVTEDPNIPLPGRTKLWAILSELETL